MAKRSQVIAAAEAFRDQLFKAASSGAFNDAERDGFSRLHGFYQDKLEAFKERPRYGEDSAYYDNPEHWAITGAADVPSCVSGDAASQQPVYDAANQGGDALDAVTNAASTSGLLSFRSSLVVARSDAAPTAPGAAAGPGARAAGTSSAGLPSFSGPPATPPTGGSGGGGGGGGGAPPNGPVPPPKKTAADPPWFAKLMTMFPAEAVTAYLTGSQYFDGGSLWLVGLTLVAVLLVRWVALMSPEGKPNVPAVLVSGFSFLLWVGATADNTLASQIWGVLHHTDVPSAFAADLRKGASFVILLWTWVLPALIKINPES